jgi:hypothetical protein
MTKGAVRSVLLTSMLGAAVPAAAEDWEWTLVPYAWGADTSLDVSVDGNDVLGGDLSFPDLVDDLHMAGQLHFEGERGRWGFLLDVTYLDLREKVTTPARPLLPDGARIDGEVELWLYEVGGFYRLNGDDTGLDLLLGVRVLDYDLDVGITLNPPSGPATGSSSSDTLTDGFIGLRYSTPLGENWLLDMRADIGAGDTDQAVNAAAYIGYLFGRDHRFAVLGGYRYLDLEMKDEGDLVETKTEMTMSGPALGFAFRW